MNIDLYYFFLFTNECSAMTGNKHSFSFRSLSAAILIAAKIRDSEIFCTAATALFTTVKTRSTAAPNKPNLQLPQPSPFTALLERFLKTQNL